MIKIVKSLRKSIFSIAMAGLLIALPSGSVTAFAQSSTDGQAKTLKELINKYDLEVVTTVPEGITPLKLNSIEEADSNFSALQEKHKERVNANLKRSSANSQKSSKNVNSLIVKSSVTSKTVTEDAGSLNDDVSLSATCTYSTNGSIVVSISSVNSRLTGSTGNWGWSQSGYTARTLDSGITRAITVNGTLTQYVYVDGKIVKYNSSESGYFEIYA